MSENSEGAKNATIDLSNIRALTPKQLLWLMRRLTINSWLICTSLLFGLAVGAFVMGWSYREGTLPEAVYAIHADAMTHRDEKAAREQDANFDAAFSDLMNWRTLQSIAAGISEEQPDGLESPFEVAVSLLNQFKTSRGFAAFLSGDREVTVQIQPTEDGFSLSWDRHPSRIKRIAQDAGYSLSSEEVRLHNTNLNWAQFSYLDDGMEHAVIFRNLDGTLSLTIRE